MALRLLRNSAEREFNQIFFNFHSSTYIDWFNWLKFNAAKIYHKLLKLLAGNVLC